MRSSWISAAALVALAVAVRLPAQNGPTVPKGDTIRGGLAATTATTFFACFVPASGTVYRIREPGTPGACTRGTHVEFSWNQAGPAGVPCTDGCVNTASLAEGAVTGAKVANGQLVRSLNAIRDDVTLAAGENITITPGGQTLTISAAGGSGTSENRPNTLVQRDASGGFAAGALTLSGKIDQTSNDGLVARGTIGDGTIPATGAGVRLMWYPAKAAFRAGRAIAVEWDDASIGRHSVALGLRTTASGINSTALGNETLASGTNATAAGVNTRASGNTAVAMGVSTVASGDQSTAFGENSVASGSRSIAMGLNAKASADYSLAMGSNTTASGNNSTAMGTATTASGILATAMGNNTTASGDNSTAMGFYASTNGRQGSFVYGDVSTTSPVAPTNDNQFIVRASGGLRLFTSSITDGFPFESSPGSGIGCAIASGALSCTGLVHAASNGFKFPDGTIQTTAATEATGTSENTPNTLVKRDDNGGFAAGALTLEGALRHTSNDGFVSIGTSGSAGTIPATGAGTRLMWYPARSAFRVGTVDDDRWDDANIGTSSIALGDNAKATQMGAVALGIANTASGTSSTAFGWNSTASGNMAIAGGQNAAASGGASVALGLGSAATGQASVALGSQTTASGSYAAAIGESTTGSGQASMAFGANTVASGNFSTALGRHTTASALSATAMGHRATADFTGSFVYGDASTETPITAGGEHRFVVRAAGGTYIYSNSIQGSGVFLSPGAGAWESVSDVKRKHFFRVVDGEDVLEKIARLSITEWSYKSQDPSIRHLGPTAQDFRAAFGLGESDTTITTTDIAGVNLLAARALGNRTEQLQSENAALRARLDQVTAAQATLARRYEELMRRLTRLETQQHGAEKLPADPAIQ